MKVPGFAFFVAAGLAGAAFAQQSPSEVTDAEIARYKQTAQQGCREPGMASNCPNGALPGGPCLLVDDVRFSGWTLAMLAGQLRRRGVPAVYPLALSTAF